ncbi:MAG: type II 3-dehydroquinate dehydratase [Clostridiales bacterium]|nr:type II 3-dehydroquinate dehydratase [Clostridiales bacterium]
MKPEILIINGPNLNLVGRREPSIYGDRSLDEYLDRLAASLSGVKITRWQSNHEGDIVDMLHESGFNHDIKGIVLNAGAYTHTSLAIADAIAAIEVPVVEVHISNIAARESIRHTSMITSVCKGIIAGFGLDSYRLAVMSLLDDNADE